MSDAEPTPLLRPFSRSLPMALLRAREAAMRLFRPTLHARNLTEQQWRVLRALASVDSIDATALAELTFLLAPSLTRILRDLEVRGLVNRRAHSHDRRVALLMLSERGAELMRAVGNQSEHIYRDIEARLGSAKLEQLMAMLDDAERVLREAEPRGEDGDAASPPPNPLSRAPPTRR